MKDQYVYANKPKVSVIIPTYNCGLYIGEAIRSVFGQTYANHETIVVDDGSTDDTQAMLAPYRERITYLYQENQGVVAARNLGIHNAQGEQIAFLDADDVWLPENLALQVQALHECPEAGWVFTDFFQFDKDRIIYRSGFGDRVHRWFNEHRCSVTDFACGWIYGDLLEGNCMHTAAVLVKKDVLDEIGCFDETFRVCQDYDLWLRVAQKYQVACVNRVLCGYRYRPDGLSGSTEAREFRWEKEWIGVLEKQLRSSGTVQELRRRIKDILAQRCWRVGWNCFSRNRFREARSSILQALRYRPFQLRPWVFWVASFLPLPMVENIRWLKRGELRQKWAELKSRV